MIELRGVLLLRIVKIDFVKQIHQVISATA